jgi:chromate transporter
LATFIGYRVAGLVGGIAATIGVFLCPWILATLAAQQIQRFIQHPWLRGFGRGAGPAVVGLLGVTAWSIGQQAFTSWPFALIALIALALGLWRKVQLIFVLLGGALLGVGISLLSLPSV